MSKRRHNFGTKRFKEKSLFIFHARIALKSLILLCVRLIARGARIGKTHTQTDTQTHRQTDTQTGQVTPHYQAFRSCYLLARAPSWILGPHAILTMCEFALRARKTRKRSRALRHVVRCTCFTCTCSDHKGRFPTCGNVHIRKVLEPLIVKMPLYECNQFAVLHFPAARRTQIDISRSS